MIHQLVIKGFQSHRSTQLNLHPNVNVVVGTSDAGKTAIIRALRWLIWNRPSGEAFRSHWGGETCVTVDIGKQRIERARDDKDNVYILNDVQFAAIKTDVPDEVSKVLNFDAVNIARQFDKPFLLDDSPGEVAQHFNRVAHLDLINSAIKNVQSWLRQINQDVETDQNRLVDLQVDLESYAGLEEIDGRVSTLEELESNRNGLVYKTTKLAQIIDEIQTTNKDIERLEPLITLADRVDGVLALIARCQTVQDKRSNLIKGVTEAQKIESVLERLTKVLNYQPVVENTLALFEKLAIAKQEVLTLIGTVTQIQTTNESLYSTENGLTTLENEFDREFPDVCPLCGKAK